MSSGSSKSWDDNQFTLANIPYGVASRSGSDKPQIATRLHNKVIFLPELISNNLLTKLDEATVEALEQPTLNNFAALPKLSQQNVRQQLYSILSATHEQIDNYTLDSFACSYNEVQMHLPVTIGDFSDFSCSMEHVLNAGEAVMGKRELPPGFLHFPVGYGGRSSSIVVSGTPIRRPLGQYRSQDRSKVEFGPSRVMDFELEIACVVGRPSKFGEPVRIEDADEHIFGVVLLNDWSARDIQSLEMSPLGPMMGKSLGTTISAWVVPLQALEPFRTKSPARQSPVALYLDDKLEKNHYDINLRAEIVQSARLNGDAKQSGHSQSTVVCNSRFDMLYWNFRHLIAHQTINGCPIRSGDLLATGTVSGSQPGSNGCLLEMTRGGKQSVNLNDGSERKALLDGDGVRLSGWAGDLGSDQCVGFGDCVGYLEPSRSLE